MTCALELRIMGSWYTNCLDDWIRRKNSWPNSQTYWILRSQLKYHLRWASSALACHFMKLLTDIVFLHWWCWRACASPIWPLALGCLSPALGRTTQGLTCVQWLSPFTASDEEGLRCWWLPPLWLHSAERPAFLFLGHLSPQWMCHEAVEVLWVAVNTVTSCHLVFSEFFEL